MKYESLHNHTTESDGAQTYLELLSTAEQNGFGVIAFTDHDMLPTAYDIEKLKSYDGPVKWLVGCEISSGLPRELGGGPVAMFHILGLFTDPTNQPLLDYCQKATAARTQRMETMVANLHKLGFKITVEDCLAASGGEAVGRPHILQALDSYPENSEVIDSLRRRMAEEALVSPDVAMKYMRMQERHVSDHPYSLFLSEDSYIPGVYVDYLYWVDMDQSVKLIRDAGGLAILAHWPTIMRKIDAEMVETFLRDKRIDGVELRTGYTDNDVERTGRLLKQIAERTTSLTTIGIDGHQENHLSWFVNDRALAEQTIGQTRRIIDKYKPSLTYSNFD